MAGPPTITTGQTAATFTAPLPSAPPAAEQTALSYHPNPDTILSESQRNYPTVGTDYLQGRLMASVPDQWTRDTQNLQRNSGDQIAPIMISISSGPPKVVLMPLAGVSGSPAEKSAKIQQYVTEGHALFESAMRGDFRGPDTPGPDDSQKAKLMWYLQALGSAKSAESTGTGAPNCLYQEGSMSIEDPDGNLEGWLTKGESYSRASSHLTDWQSTGPEHKPHGTDVRNVETPHDRRTILFARLPTESQAPARKPGSPPYLPANGPDGNKRMLFLKMEPNGCRGFTSGPARPNGPGKLARLWANIKDCVGHFFGFVNSVNQRYGAGQVAANNKERVPSDLAKRYGTLTKTCGQAFPQLKNILESDKPLSDSSGIRVMLKNITSARQWLASQPNRSDELDSALGNLEISLRSRGDHSDLRIGQEIILTRDETEPTFSATPVQRFSQDSKPLLMEGTLSPLAQNINLAASRFTTASSPQRFENQFDLDIVRGTYTIGSEVTSTPDAANTALDSLTGDPNISKTLKSFAHQGIFAAINNEYVTIVNGTQGGIMGESLEHLFSMNIARLPDSPDGTKNFTVSGTNRGTPNVISYSDGDVTMLSPESTLTAKTNLKLSFDTNGQLSVDYLDPPSYSINLVVSER